MKEKAMYIGPQGDLQYYRNSIYHIKIWIRKKRIYIAAKGLPAKSYNSIHQMLMEWKFNVEEDYFGPYFDDDGFSDTSWVLP